MDKLLKFLSEYKLPSNYSNNLSVRFTNLYGAEKYSKEEAIGINLETGIFEWNHPYPFNQQHWFTIKVDTVWSYEHEGHIGTYKRLYTVLDCSDTEESKSFIDFEIEDLFEYLVTTKYEEIVKKLTDRFSLKDVDEESNLNPDLYGRYFLNRAKAITGQFIDGISIPSEISPLIRDDFYIIHYLNIDNSDSFLTQFVERLHSLASEELNPLDMNPMIEIK